MRIANHNYSPGGDDLCPVNFAREAKGIQERTIASISLLDHLTYALAYVKVDFMSASSPTTTRNVRLFKNGRNQAVRIPREFELPGEEAVIHKDEAGRLIIEPVRRKGLVALLASWTPLPKKDAMPEIADLPPEPVDF